MELPDFQRYGWNVYQFVVGPVLRVGAVVALILYVYGAPTVANWLGSRLPSLDTLTSTDVQAFMKLYGLSTLMPLFVLVLMVACIHAVQALIFSIARYLPPHFFFRSPETAIAAMGEAHLKHLARKYTNVRDLSDLDPEVTQTIADVRHARPDDERLRWADLQQQRSGAAGTLQSACKTYVLFSLILALDALRRGNDAQALRALVAIAACAIALLAASALVLVRHKNWVKAKYNVASTILRGVEQSEFPRESVITTRLGDQRWWGIDEIDSFKRRRRRRRQVSRLSHDGTD
jgi:hypothetical protein